MIFRYLKAKMCSEISFLSLSAHIRSGNTVLGERAQASVATAAIIAVITGGVGFPAFVDTCADQQPNESLYPVEKLGESIKGTFVGAGLYYNKFDWQADRWRERLDEFENMVAENKAAEYMGVLEGAQARLKSACGCADNLHGLERAENACEKHLQVLRRVKDMVPAKAQGGIENAIKNAERYRRGLEKAENKAERRGPGADVRKVVRRRMRGVREEPVRSPHGP